MKLQDTLVKDMWYDGFMWCRGKQQGTATLRWNGKYFHNGSNEPLYHVDDPNNRSWSWSFEPNVESTGESAL